MRRPPRLPALLAFLALAGPAAGQGAPQRALGPLETPTDHWAYPLLDRMAAAGLLDGVWLPGRRPAGARAVGAALDSAVARARQTASPWLETATRARAWYRAELGPGSRGALRIQPLAGGRVTDGPRTDPGAALAGVRVLVQPSAGWGLWAEPVAEARDGELALPTPRLGAAWRPGNLRVAVSHGALRFEPGAGGGIVAGGGAELGRVEVGMAEPARLPWVLRHVGPTQASVSVSRIAGDSLGPAVAFVTGEVRFQPHPRLTFGLYRSAVVTWTIDGQHPDAGDLAFMLIGKHTDFDDQRAAFSASLRADALGLTLLPYLVWGFEDSAGIDEDPGIVAGLWAPALPVGGMPLGLRYEYSAFGEDAQAVLPWTVPFEIRSWYHHSGSVRDAYVDGSGDLLGHPLGGYGHEHRVELEAPVPSAGLMLRAALFSRDRQDPAAGRANLLYGVLPGRSRGGALDAWVAARGLRVEARLLVEDGAEGWSRASARVLARLLLP